MLRLPMLKLTSVVIESIRHDSLCFSFSYFWSSSSLTQRRDDSLFLDFNLPTVMSHVKENSVHCICCCPVVLSRRDQRRICSQGFLLKKDFLSIVHNTREEGIKREVSTEFRRRKLIESRGYETSQRTRQSTREYMKRSAGRGMCHLKETTHKQYHSFHPPFKFHTFMSAIMKMIIIRSQ